MRSLRESLALRESLPFIVSALLVIDILLRADLLSSPRGYVATSTMNATHLHSNGTFQPLEKPLAGMHGNLTACPKSNANATLSFKDFLSKSDFGDIGKWAKDDLEKWFKGVQEFQIQEPLVPVNVSCGPKPLPLYNDTICDKRAFPGGKKPPVKVGHAIQFGFDVDTLEIHLNEIYEVVDKIFITEMTIQHNQFFPTKQLIWDRVKNQDRFRKFRDKVIHFVLDDLDVARMKNGSDASNIWVGEGYQERKRWQKIQEWNEYTQFFGADDVIGFGDTDEIASRENIHQIKHCQFHTNSIDVGIWFPFGRIDQAFASDFPVSGHKYTLGDPTFWKYASASSQQKAPSRMRGKSGNFLLGGMHMSHYNYLPYALVKSSSATEAQPSETLKSLVSKVAVAFQQDKLLELDENMSQIGGRVKAQTKKLNALRPSDIEGIVYLPWFYDCNRDRYPRWEGKPDSRMGF